MKGRAHGKGLVAATVAVVVCVAFSLAYADHQWSSYHWERPDSNDLILDVGDCHTASSYTNWSNRLTDVVANWNYISQSGVDPAYPNVLDVPGLQIAKSNCNAGDIKSYNSNYGNTGWLGLATIWVTRGKDKHIVQGEAKVNEYYITLSGYDGFNESVEWQQVMCQEVGHTFGLDHNREGPSGGQPDDTCMNDETRPLRYPRTNVHDAEQLTGMYAHYHSGGGGGGGGPGGGPPGGRPGGPPGGAGPATVLAQAYWAERYQSTQTLFEAADLVVNATVLSSGFSHYAGQGAAAVPITRVLLQVNETFRGFSERAIVLEQTRGPALEVVDDPGYVQGDNYLLFLRRIGVNTYRTVNPDGRIRQ